MIARNVENASMSEPQHNSPTIPAPPEHVAAIAAAAVFTLGPRARVSFIEPIGDAAGSAPEAGTVFVPDRWSDAGRRELMTSHRLRRARRENEI